MIRGCYLILTIALFSACASKTVSNEADVDWPSHTLQEVVQSAEQHLESISMGDLDVYDSEIFYSSYSSSWMVIFETDAGFGEFFAIRVDDKSGETKLLRGR